MLGFGSERVLGIVLEELLPLFDRHVIGIVVLQRGGVGKALSGLLRRDSGRFFLGHRRSNSERTAIWPRQQQHRQRQSGPFRSYEQAFHPPILYQGETAKVYAAQAITARDTSHRTSRSVYR